jgi:uncharacterized protein (DUF2267 family)
MATKMNIIFQRVEEKAFEWLEDIQEELGYDDLELAFVAFRAVSHALRDRLTVDEAADLSAQLPLFLKGIYFDGWKPAGKPIKYRHQDDFLDRVAVELRDYMDVYKATKGVCKILQKHISPGEIQNIKADLPKDLQIFFD